MGSEERAVGFVLRCDDQGNVLEIVLDDLGVAGGVETGRSFTRLVDRANLGKALTFLAEVRTQGAAFGWELNVRLENRLTTLHFAGLVLGDDLLIMGARTNNGVMQLYEELMRINNEQMNALRAASKARAGLSADPLEREGSLYDELSRLNNELVTLQRELAKKNAQLERLNALKDRFLGMAAHDLRNPLSAILSYSEFLLDEASGVLSDEHVEFLGIIRSSSQFMLRLVDDLLDVSTIEAGRLTLERQPTDLATLAARNVALNGVLAEKKQIALSFQQEDHLPTAMLDPTKIEQVLNNLISNAVKFSYPGSAVEVRLVRREDEAVLSVRDQGQGIPADQVENLFNFYGRTGTRSTAGEKSTGLGLAIARRIVEGHGGAILVESRVGEGSTFTVSLPLEPAAKGEIVAQPAAREGARPDLEPERGRWRVLVADDSALNQRVTVRMLEKRGHRVMAVDDGRQAVAAWEREPFDLILMDVHMPEMDGLEATMAIREREAARGTHIPIVALTATLDRRDRDACRNAGMDAVASKPIQTEELFQTIEQLLDSRPGDAETVEAVLNLQEIMGRVEGDRELLKDLIAIFQEEAEAQLAHARDALARRDADALARAAHTLKGAAGQFGAASAYDTAARLEALARKGDLAAAGQAVTDLETEVGCLRAALADWMAGDGGVEL